jgi:hypothetical protein
MLHSLLQFSPEKMTDNIKEFFTESEWDLIYDLLDSNRQYDDNEEYVEDYSTALNKIHSLFNETT